MLAAVLTVCAVISSKTIKIAFYGGNQRIQTAIKTEISNLNLRRVRYTVLDEGEPLPKNIRKKHSILIAKNSLAIRNSAGEFIQPDERLLEALPISIRKSTALEGGGHYAIPLLLGHFEIAYYENSRQKLGLEIPQSYGGLLRYLERVKEAVDIPLICAGAEDTELLNFVSAISESLYGAADYKKMLADVRESSALNKSALPESLTRVLDEVKAMQSRELIFPRWTKVTLRDVRYNMQERAIGAVAMSLTFRRDLEYNLVKYYSSNFFPRYNNSAEHGIIAPQTVACLLTKKKNAALLLGHLVSADVQSGLSDLSLLAPAASRAEAYDRQADDVRFWAASSSAGALSGIAEECDVSKERIHSLAQKIRVYLEY